MCETPASIFFSSEICLKYSEIFELMVNFGETPRTSSNEQADKLLENNGKLCKAWSIWHSGSNIF